MTHLFLKKMGRYEKGELKGGYDPNSSKFLTQNKHRAGATPDEILRAPAAPIQPAMEPIPAPPSYIPRNTTPGFILLILLSICLGLRFFGFLGLFVGPILLSAVGAMRNKKAASNASGT